MAVMTNQTRTMKRPRVLLADDHQMLVDALKSVRVFWSLAAKS